MAGNLQWLTVFDCFRHEKRPPTGRQTGCPKLVVADVDQKAHVPVSFAGVAVFVQLAAVLSLCCSRLAIHCWVVKVPLIRMEIL